MLGPTAAGFGCATGLHQCMAMTAWPMPQSMDDGGVMASPLGALPPGPGQGHGLGPKTIEEISSSTHNLCSEMT